MTLFSLTNTIKPKIPLAVKKKFPFPRTIPTVAIKTFSSPLPQKKKEEKKLLLNNFQEFNNNSLSHFQPTFH